jgi:chaperonin GroEL
MMLTTECVLSEHKDENAAAMPPMPPMGGGMPGMM